jgi:ribonuclease BN (tRNA processing enzyme)
MRLTVIGAGPAYTDRPGSTGASYLLRHGSNALLLDLGQGSFPRLASTMDPADLDAVVVSHLHPDHFVDLVPLRHYLKWQEPHGRRVRVIAPPGLTDRLDGLHDEPGFTAASLDVEDVEPGPWPVPGFRLDAERVTHTTSSFGYRVSAGSPAVPKVSGLVYSGDCGRAEDLEALIRPGDTLLTEVSFGPGPVPVHAMHLDGPSVGALAARTGVARVLLTHIQMGFDRDETIASVRALYDGPVELVDPGFETEL